MEQKFEVGRIGPIPIVLDSSFIILLLVFGWKYFSLGTFSGTLVGLIVVVGGVGSILLHELAHAWAGRFCKVDTTHIELHGFGGFCHFARGAAEAQHDIFISLAGPASNLALWAMFHWLGVGVEGYLHHMVSADPGGFAKVGHTLSYGVIWHTWLALTAIAYVNIALVILNLMPSFPLDGGRALSVALSNRIGGVAAEQVVAHLGLIVCLGLVWYGIKYEVFGLVLAYMLFEANREVFERHGDAPWKRWV